MKKRIVNALLAGFLLVSATACGKQPAADTAQPQADPTQAYLDTVDVDYAYDLALKLEDIRSNETLGYRTAERKKPQTHLRPWLETSKQRELPFSA